MLNSFFCNQKLMANFCCVKWQKSALQKKKKKTKIGVQISVQRQDFSTGTIFEMFSEALPSFRDFAVKFQKMREIVDLLITPNFSYHIIFWLSQKIVTKKFLKKVYHVPQAAWLLAALFPISPYGKCGSMIIQVVGARNIETRKIHLENRRLELWNNYVGDLFGWSGAICRGAGQQGSATWSY